MNPLSAGMVGGWATAAPVIKARAQRTGRPQRGRAGTSGGMVGFPPWQSAAAQSLRDADGMPCRSKIGNFGKRLEQLGKLVDVTAQTQIGPIGHMRPMSPICPISPIGQGYTCAATGAAAGVGAAEPRTRFSPISTQRLTVSGGMYASSSTIMNKPKTV